MGNVCCAALQGNALDTTCGPPRAGARGSPGRTDYLGETAYMVLGVTSVAVAERYLYKVPVAKLIVAES